MRQDRQGPEAPKHSEWLVSRDGSQASDPWGVPASFFGGVPEDFYGVVGRVVMLSALLENRLHVLLSALDSDQADRLAGQSGTVLIGELRRRLHRYPEEHRVAAVRLLDRAERALQLRHEVVHSLWPFGRLTDVRGWRDIPRKRGLPPERGVWTELTADTVPQLVRELVSLYVELVHRVEPWAQLRPVTETDDR